MRRSKSNRAVAALIATAVIVAGCSSSDDDTSPTTGVPPETTETTEMTEDAPETTESGLRGEGLAVALLAPAPGLLAGLFQGQERGTSFAATDVDAAGGVLDGPLTVSTTRAEPGAEPIDNVRAAIDGGAQALIGPAGSDNAVDVRNEVATLGSIACSASATLPRITLEQDVMSLFRTALPDDITTTYLAGAISARRDAEAPGVAWKVAIVGRTDEYGLSISSGLAATLEAAGMAPTVIGYNPRRVNFAGTARQVVAAAPDLTVLVTYEEGGNLLSSLISSGLKPAAMVGLDAFFAPRIADIATPGGDAAAADGFTMLGSMGNKAFLERLYADDSNAQVANAAQAYDCAITLALAAAAVDASTSIAAAVRDVTDGGVTCTTYADCLDKLNAGENIDFDGVSGQLAIDENGDPTFARFTTGVLRAGAITEISSTDINIADIRRQQAAYAAAAQITKIQQALTFLEFYEGPINGLDTAEFRTALAAFQTSVGLAPTGIFDEATDAALRAALGSFAELLSAATADIQRLMTDLGFYEGPIDGIWTDELTTAVRALQAQLGVPQTGVLDAATLRAIYAAGEESGANTTTTTIAPPETTAPPTTVSPETTVPDVPVPPIDPPDPGLPTLLDVLADAGNFTSFLKVLVASGYETDDGSLNQYTVFAPNDQALVDAGIDVDALIASNDAAGLFELLSGYVAEGRLEIAELDPAVGIDMISGNNVAVVVDGATVIVGGAPVLGAPREALNGIVYELTSLYTS